MTLLGDVVKRIQAMSLRCDCGPDGDWMSDVAVVAEAPGHREVMLKSPLVGGSGKLLWSVLRKYDITRNKIYVTNVIKRALTAADTEDKIKVPALELQHWQGILRWELSRLPNLKHVVILGDMALQTLTGHKGITAWRGSVFEGDITWVDVTGTTTKRVTFICANNPAAVLRPNGPSESVFHMDVGRLHLLRTGDWVQHHIEHRINPSVPEAIEWVRRMQTEGKPVAFDIETIGGETACIGLANDPHEGMCINFRDRRSNRWSLEDEVRVRRVLQGLFRNEAVKFVAHNGNFDSNWLWFKDRIRVHKVWFDTMLAHHWLWSTLPHSLGFLCTQFTSHPYYKDDLHEWREGGDIDTFWRYNVKDVCITIACQQRLEKELRNARMEAGFYDHVMRLQPELVRMTVGGVRIDVAAKDKINADLTEQVNLIKFDWENRCRLITNDPSITVNPDSPRQVGKLLFDQLGLVGYGRSTDALNRQRIKGHPRTSPEAIELLNLMDRYKEEDKFQNTYTSMQIDDDNRFRTEYKQMGVRSAPGRLSSSSTMWGSGMNGQNMPQRAYDMFVADTGYTLLYCDGGQAEARVVGWVAEIESWMAQFERARVEGGYDCHRALAAEMFGVPYDQVPTYDRDQVTGKPTLRFIAKRCRHGLNYRMGPGRLAEVTGLSLRDAESAHFLYHRLTPQLKVWWHETEQTVRTTKQLFSAYGRRLVFLDHIGEEDLQSIVAFYPQSTIGDHVCRVIYMSHSDPEWPEDAAIRMNTHDGLISLVPVNKVVQCARVIRRHAEHPIPIKGRELIVPFEFKVGMPNEQGVISWATLRTAANNNDLESYQQQLTSRMTR